MLLASMQSRNQVVEKTVSTVGAWCQSKPNTTEVTQQQQQQYVFHSCTCLGCCKQHCNEHLGACIFQKSVFLQIYAQEYYCRIIWQLYFQFLKEPRYYLSQWLYQFTFLPTVQKGNLSSTPPVFIVGRFLDDGHSDWCEVIARCNFDLHFFNNL